jgi:hypothetical protein
MVSLWADLPLYYLVISIRIAILLPNGAFRSSNHTVSYEPSNCGFANLICNVLLQKLSTIVSPTIAVG